MFFSSTTKRQHKVKFCFLFGGPIQPLDLFAFHLDLKRIWNIQRIFVHAFIHKQYWVISTICRPSFSRSQVKSIFLYSSLGGTQWVDIVHWTIHYRGSDFCLVGHIGAVRAPAPQNITLGNFHEHWPLSRTKIRKWGNCAVFRFMLWVRVEEAAEMSELSLIYLFVLPIVRKPLCESLKTPQKEF